VVGLYSIRDAWFPNRFSLQGTSRIHILCAVIGDQRYSGYKTPTCLNGELFIKLKMVSKLNSVMMFG
jgi:hypothetical protein